MRINKIFPILILVLLVTLSIMLTSQPAYAQVTVGNMQNLGTLGADDSSATGINDIGQVVGYSTTTELLQHPFLWNVQEGMLDLCTSCEGHSVHAEDINNLGQVVGWSQGGSLVQNRAFWWTAQGGMVDLGTLIGEGPAEAYGINDLGQIVGYSNSHTFIWTTQEGMIDLTPGEGCCSSAFDINNLGQVVGSHYSTSGQYHAFLWSAQEGIVDLGTLGGKGSIAFGINNHGQVVGRSDTASGQWHAFLWTIQEGMIDLGTLGGSYSDAFDINDMGQVVGRSFITSDKYHAFLWTSQEGMEDLGTFGGDCTIGECGYSTAFGINNLGQIVGWSDAASGHRNAFVKMVYNFSGFFQPVDNLPTWNSVKAGSAIPIKFSLNGNHGLDIFTTGYPASQNIGCDSSKPIDPIEGTVVAGSSSLSYNTVIDQYNYIWKTDKSWTGNCKQLTILLKDGTYHNASFKFLK